MQSLTKQFFAFGALTYVQAAVSPNPNNDDSISLADSDIYDCL